MPPEILAIILAFVDIPLSQLYHLRLLSKSLSDVALSAFISRLKQVLVINKDTVTLFKFMDEIRPTDGASFSADAETPDGTRPLGPFSMGCLLRRVGVPAESTIIASLMDRVYYDYEARSLGLLLKGMKASPSELRLLVQTRFVESKDDDILDIGSDLKIILTHYGMPEQEMMSFVQGFSWPFAERCWVLAVLKGFVWDEEGEGTDIEFDEEPTYLPKLLDDVIPWVIERAKYEGRQFPGQGRWQKHLAAFFNYAMDVADVEGIELLPSQLLVPTAWLSIADLAEVFLDLTSDFHSHMTSTLKAFTWGQDTRARKPPPGPVSMEDIQRFFQVLEAKPDFPRVLGRLAVSNVWPKTVNRFHPEQSFSWLVDDPQWIRHFLHGILEESHYAADKNIAKMAKVLKLKDRKEVWEQEIRAVMQERDDRTARWRRVAKMKMVAGTVGVQVDDEMVDISDDEDW